MSDLFQGASRVGMALVSIAALSAAYQFVCELIDLKQYPPPGRLVDVGGRQLHLLCAGSGAAPTVIIEAGSGDDSTLWEGMVRRVSGFAKVCTYDRAGLGWSDPARSSRTIDDRAKDLHALLAAANISGPYILVGHSYGGYIARRFAAIYPDGVAGLVLVDAPEEEFSFAPDGLKDIDRTRSSQWRLGWMTRLGFVRLGVLMFPDYFDPVKGVPADVRGQMTALALRTARHFERADEMASFRKVPTAWRVASGFGLLRGMPLVVISAGVGTIPEWRQGQMRLTRLSNNSTHVIAQKSGHAIQFSEPDVIVDAIRHILPELDMTATNHGAGEGREVWKSDRSPSRKQELNR